MNSPEAIAKSRQREINMREEKQKREQAWDSFFEKMTDEEFFEYYDRASNEASKWQTRMRAAQDYTRRVMHSRDHRFYYRFSEWREKKYAKHS